MLLGLVKTKKKRH